MKKINQKIAFALFVVLDIASFNVSAQWNSKGPYGGSVSAMATSDTNIIIGSAKGGVFINTTAAANEWKPVNYGMKNGEILAVAAIGNKMLASTMAGFYFSTDRGATWNINTTAPLGHVYSFHVLGGYVFAGVSKGIYRSADSGKTWVQVNTGIGMMAVSCFASDGTNMYAATVAGKVFTSANNGTFWNDISAGLSGVNINALAVSGGKIFAGTNTGVYQSPISSISWSAANTGLVFTDVYCLHASGGTLYAGTMNGLYTSPDAAIVWASANTGMTPDVVNTVGVYGSEIFAGTENFGIFTSLVSPVSFTSANSGFNNLQSAALAASDPLIVMGATAKGVHRSATPAINYTYSSGGITDSFHVTCMKFAGTKVFAGTQAAGMFVSNDTGKTWSAINTGLTSMNIKAMAVSATDIYIGTAGADVYKSPLGSISWTNMATGLPSNIDITGLAEDSGNLYVSSKTLGVYRYVDTAWVSFNAGLSIIPITCITAHKEKVYAGTSYGGVIVASPESPNWKIFNDSLPSLNITTICSVDSYIVVGYKGGLKFTRDNGKYWMSPDTQLSIPAFAEVTGFAYTAGNIFISTANNSFYSSSKSVIPAVSTIPATGIHDVVKTKSRTAGIMVIPNPNSGIFDIKVSNKIIKEITVYDITGRLMNKLKNVAEQKVNLNYPKGTYFIHATTTDGVLTEKLIIE